MFDKLSFLEERYNKLCSEISDPAVIADQQKFRTLCKEQSDILPIVEQYKLYKEQQQRVDEAKQMLDETLDKEFRELVQSEYDEGREKLEQHQEQLRVLLLPKDPNDEKSVIVEIRGGAGGDEAALFAGDLFRMYSMYAETRHWGVEMLNLNATELGGIKEISFGINGKGAYSRLKYESGVHRVQRIPSTESGGRIHTSTVTVAVLPEVEEVEIDIGANDLRIDVFRAGGPGGQYVNTTDSAVRITHIPTGLVVSCQDEKSQHKNKEKAMKILRSRLYDVLQEQQNAEIAKQRKSQVGTGDRSERIRTYNYPQGRVSDHRIGLTLHKLDAVLNGEMDELINALITHYQAEKLKNNS
ncbi:MAG: peptide chain release factor 1 [Firmicutes bacterium]|nr:peptide chain release factor 1 [Bacillota bacterium]